VAQNSLVAVHYGAAPENLTYFVVSMPYPGPPESWIVPWYTEYTLGTDTLHVGSSCP
jgi:hypothetical protein